MRRNGKDKQTMTSIRLSRSQLESLRKLLHNSGFENVSGLIRFIATRKKLDITVEIGK